MPATISLPWAAPTDLRIDLTSERDTYLYLVGDDGTVVDENNNCGAKHQLPHRTDGSGGRDLHFGGYDVLPQSGHRKLRPEHWSHSLMESKQRPAT